MSKVNTVIAAPKLAPVVAKSKKQMLALATQDGRKRGIAAINENGELVVCCRRTAKKNGWEIQEVLYAREPAAPVVEEPVKAKAKAKKPLLNAKADRTKDRSPVADLCDLLGG